MNELLILVSIFAVFLIGCLTAGMIDLYTDKKKKQRRQARKAYIEWKKNYKLFVGKIEK